MLYTVITTVIGLSLVVLVVAFLRHRGKTYCRRNTPAL